MTPSTMQQMIGKKVLITTDNWFYAPDGKHYRSVFGTLNGVQNALETLGIKVNSRSHDWYITVGNMTIAGCQIHYAIQTDEVNDSNLIEDWTSSPEAGCKIYQRPNVIYFADPKITKKHLFGSTVIDGKEVVFLSDELQPLAIEVDQHGQPLPQYKDLVDQINSQHQLREQESAVSILDQSKTDG